MTEENKDYKIDQLQRNLSYKSEFDKLKTYIEMKEYKKTPFGDIYVNAGRSWTYKEKNEYLEVIDVIESLMIDENFPLEKENSRTIKKILYILNKAISENLNFTEAWLIKGTILYKTGKYSDSIEVFDYVLETIPKLAAKESQFSRNELNGTNYKYALRLKALAMFKLGWYREGLNILNEILGFYPTDAEIQEYKKILCTLQEEKILTFLGGSSILSGETDIEPNRYYCVSHGFVSLQDISWNDDIEPQCRKCDNILYTVPSVKTKRYYCKYHGFISNKKIVWNDEGPHCLECKRLLEVIST